MKVAVTSTGPALDDRVEARFGRCAYFLIIHTDSMQYETVENPNLSLGGGAGIQSAQLMSEKGVTAVLTGNCGPNAFNVFGQAGIRVIVGVSGTVRQAIEQFKAGALSSAAAPNVVSHFGMGGGMGRRMGGGGGGGGMGSGRGGGMGRGRGTSGMAGYMTPPPAVPLETGNANADSDDVAEELTALKQQVQMLEQQKQELDRRINKITNHHNFIAVVDSEKCTGCGLCVKVCPAGAIEINRHAFIHDQLCTGCGICESHCPLHAITMVMKIK